MEDDLNIHVNGRGPPKLKKQQCNLKQRKAVFFYAILKNSTAQLLPVNLTNTTTKNILAQLKQINLNWM